MCKGLYSPKISEDLIPHIFGLAQKENITMTKVVDDILRADLHIKGLINDQEALVNQGRRFKKFPERERRAK